MADTNLDIELKVVVKLGEKTFESVLDKSDGLRINGFRFINAWDIEVALRKFILRNCADEDILTALAVSDIDKREMAYNPNLSHEMADMLADELCKHDEGGTYPYEFCVMMSNPSLSGKKLDSFANRFLEEYQYLMEVNDQKPDYEYIYLLRYIAKNPSVSEDTLETLKRSGISMVVEATKR